MATANHKQIRLIAEILEDLLCYCPMDDVARGAALGALGRLEETLHQDPE